MQRCGRRVTLVPAVDIVEDTNGVTLRADLPGVSRENLQVSFNDGALHIEGQAVVPTSSGLRVQHAEIRQPHFARSFSLRTGPPSGHRNLARRCRFKKNEVPDVIQWEP